MALRTLVEVWPAQTGIYIHELPGVYASGVNPDAALEQLPGAVEHHLVWLASHGFDTSDAAVEIAIAEVLPALEGRFGPLFEADREPVTPEQVDYAVQVASLARRDLIDLYRSVSDVRRSRRPDPESWSMADHLLHIAAMERFYMNVFPWTTETSLPDEPVRALQASARLAEGTLREIPADHRSAVFVHAGEQWTLSKVLRRMTGHLREHLPWMRGLARG